MGRLRLQPATCNLPAAELRRVRSGMGWEWRLGGGGDVLVRRPRPHWVSGFRRRDVAAPSRPFVRRFSKLKSGCPMINWALLNLGHETNSDLPTAAVAVYLPGDGRPNSHGTGQPGRG